jgi:hypothetical protein
MNYPLRIRSVNPETLLQPDRDGAETITDVPPIAAGATPPSGCDELPQSLVSVGRIAPGRTRFWGDSPQLTSGRPQPACRAGYGNTSFFGTQRGFYGGGFFA